MTSATGRHRRFHHEAPGTPASGWRAAGVADAPPFSLADVDRVVVAAAHPDDETLGAAGLIVTARRLGLPVTVIVLTAGERSHPDSPTYPPQRLGALRRREIVDALGHLDDHLTMTLLSYPDGRLDRFLDGAADALARAIPDDGRRTLLVAPWRADGHPDHEAAGAAAALVATGRRQVELVEYPVWYWHWGEPRDADAVPLVRLSLDDDAMARKSAALASFPSQTEGLSADVRDAPVLSPSFLDHFRTPYELFVASGHRLRDRGAALEPGYFDQMYAASSDPWGFVDRHYEKRKRALTMAVLPRRRFHAAFEPGCSIGLLTEQLATRCDSVLATDVAPAALQLAAERMRPHSNVRLEKLSIAEHWPPGPFDLVLLSEVGYYLAADGLLRLAAHALQSLTSDGCLVACHWRHAVAEYPTTGDAVHAALRRTPGFALLAEHIEDDFRLDVLVRAPAVSVAAAEGLA